jgi:hypothetical protein
MRLDRIVELWQDLMRSRIDPLFLFSRELQFCSVRCRVPRRLAAHPGLRFRGANEIDGLFDNIEKAQVRFSEYVLCSISLYKTKNALELWS